MTDTISRATALLLAAALLSGCVANGNPGGGAVGETVNDPDFSGVTNTEALDDSYSPQSGL